MKKRNDILFVNPGRYLYPYPPLGLGYLASYLKRYSECVREVTLVDENAKDSPESLIKEYQPKIVGITATTPQIVRAHEIAKYCKSLDPKIICIIGGVHCTVLPRETLKEFPGFDLGVYGEGEETFRELVDVIYRQDFRLDDVAFFGIKGLVYRQDLEVLQSPDRGYIEDLDSIPLPDRSLYNLDYYLKPRQAIRGIACKAIQIMSSRGCPYNCRFCSSSLMWHRQLRFHSPERFLAEVEELRRLGCNGFYLHDDTFIADKARVFQICEGLIKRGYHKNMVWAAQLRPNLIRDESDVAMLRLMKKAGCLQVEYGFESGSLRMLSFLKKEAATVEQNQKALELSKKAGLRVFGNFMMGTEGETEDEMRETEAFINRNLTQLDYYQVYLTTPYPGTELWHVCEKENLLKNITWEKFGMGILADFVFSNTARPDFVHGLVQKLTNQAVGKISFRDKFKWLRVRLADDPRYVLTMLKSYFLKRKQDGSDSQPAVRRKKIGVMIGQIRQMGGVGVAAFEEVRNLRKLGYDVELIILKERKGYSHNDIFTEGLPLRFISREIPWPFNISFDLPFFSFLNSFHLTSPFLVPWVIKKNEYDFLIVHETYNSLTALTLKWFRGIPFYPFIWDPISYILPRVYAKKPLHFAFPLLLPLGRFLDRLIIREAKRVLLGSRAHLSLLQKISGRNNFEIVYSGCYPQATLPDRRGKFIVALTKWDIGKNPNFLLEVVNNLQDNEARLVVAGNWVQESLRNEFVKRVSDLGLEERVELTGWIDDKMKTNLFLRARVLIHPIIEAFGLFGLEAAACGCPIIVPEGSGVAELFENGRGGYFPKEGNLAGFARCLDQLLSDERKAWEMGRGAWEVAKKNTWEIHTKHLLEVLEK